MQDGATGATGPQGSGLNTLTNVTQVFLGDPNCPNGGQFIRTGLDINQDNVLASSEVQYQYYLCNGSTGPRRSKMEQMV